MKKTVSIIGGGPAAMLLAAHLNPDLFQVTIYEKNIALGRKFLVAGKGGFNLTHSENLESFIDRYTPSHFLKETLTSFSNNDLRAWLESLNIPTFIGSSKRVYPVKGIKPIAVLDAILNDLKKKNVILKTKHNWLGWNEKDELLFENDICIASDITVFALGGASWKKTGSDGGWLTYFNEQGINTIPFQASNCAYQIDWKEKFISKSEGLPLKNISITCNNKTQKGEIVITNYGIEGGAIYALSPQIRTQLTEHNLATIFIDFKPTLSVQGIISKLTPSKLTQQLSSTLKLEKVKINLLKHYLTKEQFLDIEYLAKTIKAFPLTITENAPIDEAISTVGGIDLTEIDTTFQLIKKPNHYVIGEMLDYDAPTGGYLLQSCFSMGAWVAKKLNINE